MLRYRKIWVYKAVLLGVLPFAGLLWSPAALAAPEHTAAAAIVLEARSNTVLFAANATEPLPPASTGKILTALLALDVCDDLQQSCTVSAAAAAVDGSSAWLTAGESWTLAELLTGALVHSGNDACYAIAEAVAGSEPLFVHWLNMKAAVLGATSARLYNSNGLPAAGHVISAADLAGISAVALENDFFARTVASRYAQIGAGATARSYQNTNRLLWHDPHIVGVKTGTTDAAGACLVAAYADGAALYVSVVLHSGDRWGDSLRLLRWAAQSYVMTISDEGWRLQERAAGAEL